MDEIIISKSPFANQPVRSISLPPRIHPSSQRIEALLSHLKHHHHHQPQSSVSTSTTTCFEADTIHNDLVVLAELYSCMEELFQYPQTQQALLHYQDGKLVEQALCGSVTLLDACGSARDLLLALRENVQSLQSAIRRRRRDNSAIETSISAYDRFRKNAKKEISKQIVQLKKMENKIISNFPLLGHQDQKLVFLARILRESSTITISILCSLLPLFMSMPALGTKGSSLISKLRPKRLFSNFNKEQKKNNVDGVADLNIALCSLIGRENKSEPIGEVVQGALRVLEGLNVDIDGLEGGLDSIFRCLVRNRVSFLNMLAH